MGLKMVKRGLLVLLMLVCAAAAWAHDGWVQSNVAKVRSGDMVYFDLQFGNHGNTHRDYLIYGSKWDLSKGSFVLHTPSGGALDLKSSVIDVGKDESKTVNGGPYVDKNGYLAVSFQTAKKGLYIMDARQDMVVSYAPERSVKGAKCLVASVPNTIANYGNSIKGYDQVLGQELEIVPLDNPTELAVGDTLKIKVRFRGQPLADGCVTVIPRGVTLPPFGIPNPYDLMTDMDGVASYTFDQANYHLVVAHLDLNEGGVLDGKTYTTTKFTAALTVIVKPR
jgi:uncharacterized GH25 family protein